MSSPSPEQRFSDRVENYVRYRPSYPLEIIPLLQRETGLIPQHVIADVGSGTGISAELFCAQAMPFMLWSRTARCVRRLRGCSLIFPISTV